MEETKETQESLQRKREQALQRLRKERTEEALWDCVTAYQDFEFHTYSGLPYSYHMKYGRSGTYTKELWINRREKSKSLVLELVRSAYQKVLEFTAGERKTGCRAPESAGRYPWNHVYLRHLLRVCPAGNAGKSKRKKLLCRQQDKKSPEKINFSPMQVLTTTHWVI